jgi:hypothetical protein
MVLLTALLVALLPDATTMVTALFMPLVLLTDTRLFDSVRPMPNPLTLDPTCELKLAPFTRPRTALTARLIASTAIVVLPSMVVGARLVA